MRGNVGGHETEAHICVRSVFKDADNDRADADDFLGFVGADGGNVSDGFHSRGEGDSGLHGRGHVESFGLELKGKSKRLCEMVYYSN